MYRSLQDLDKQLQKLFLRRLVLVGFGLKIMLVSTELSAEKRQGLRLEAVFQEEGLGFFLAYRGQGDGYETAKGW